MVATEVNLIFKFPEQMIANDHTTGSIPLCIQMSVSSTINTWSILCNISLKVLYFYNLPVISTIFAANRKYRPIFCRHTEASVLDC